MQGWDIPGRDRVGLVGIRRTARPAHNMTTNGSRQVKHPVTANAQRTLAISISTW